MLLWLLAGVGLLFLGLGGVRWVAATDPKTLLLALKTLAIAVAAVVGVLLVLSGRAGWLLGLLPLLLPWMLRRSSLARGGLGGGGRTAGRTSHVQTRFFDMRLDHDTGELDGEVREGPHAGRPLSELGLRELLEMLPEVRSRDSQSGRLLEAYLDRRAPDWRSGSADEGGNGEDAAQEPGGADPPGAMTPEEALRVLGLTAGASEQEIKAAYHRLIRYLHPDQGGSSFLAAQVNRARDVLLDRRHR